MRYAFILFLGLFFAFPALADCTGPAGAESATRYDFTAHKLYYCNGTNWVEAGGAGGGSSIQRVSTAFTVSGSTKQGYGHAACPAGYKITGGGCYAVAWGSSIVHSYPEDETRWACAVTHTYTTNQSATALALCMKD